MNKKQILLTFLFVLGIMSCVVSQAFAQTQIPITQGCYVTMEPNRYIVHFNLPDYTYEDEDGNDYEEGNGDEGDDDGCGTFSEIVIYNNEDYDVTDIPGYPALPFLSMDLLLPECAENVTITEVSTVSNYDNPPYYISPAFMGSEVDENGDVIEELDEDCYNIEYYTSGTTNDFPNGFYNHACYTESGYNGITFSIFPFSYHPENGQMEVLRSAEFIIEFDCGDLENTIEEIIESPTIDAVAAQLYFDTFSGQEIVSHISTGENGSYLIIASHRDMEGNLSPYVQYKLSQNYNVEVLYLDELGALGDRMLIEFLINNNGLLPNPDYVLLVGTLNDIPAGGSGTRAHPFTDDGYHPRLGRWLISDIGNYSGHYPDIDNIINKTIDTETGYVNNNSKAALFSGKDSKKRKSKFFYNDIKKIANTSFSTMGIFYGLYNGRTMSESNAQSSMNNALQNHPRFFIYSGHGNSTKISEPYNITTTNIGFLSCNYPYAMGFGFACHLNSYTTDNNFGARWVATPNIGGVTFYGSTITTFDYPDRYLSKKIFKQLRKITNKIANFPISLWLRIGEDKYYNALKVVWRRRQVKKYNLIGDPTLAVYGMDNNGTYAPFHAPERGNFETNVENNSAQISKIEIYDINGRIITSSDCPINIETIPMQPGVYVVRTIFADNTFETNKIIK